MPHKAFLHKKSLLDQFKDDHKHTGIIQSMRAEHTWNNPLTRKKRTKKLNGWIKSFDGKNHIRKLSRFNAVQTHRHESRVIGEYAMQNEAMSLKGFIENLSDKLVNKYGLEKDVVKNYLNLHTEEMQELLDDKELSLKEKVLFVRSEITGEKDENKKSESVPESDYIQEFRSWLDAQEGEQYNEQEITDFGWEWKSQDVGYPNGNKTYYDYFTMEDDGVTYRLEVAWNSFNETIVGNKIWQDSSEAKKSERLFNKREMERIALSEGSKVSPYLVEIAHKILKDDYGWKASTIEEVADWLGDHKQAFEHAYGQALRNSDDDKANVKVGIEAALAEEEQGVMNAEIAMMGESKKHEGFNTTRDLDNFALHILNYIKDKTHYPGYVRFVKLNDDEEDFYGKYVLSVNGKNYYLYVGDTDYSITDNNDENTLVEGSTDLSGAMNKDLDDFCERIQQPFYTESKKPTDEKLGYEKGHKNSRGEDAPWVIRSHEDNRILASFANKKDAEEHLKRMKQYSKDESKKSEGLSNEQIKDAVKFSATEAGINNYITVDSDGAMSVTVSLPINSADLKTVRWVIDSNDGTITEYLDTEKNLIRDFTDDESLVSMLTLLFQTSRMELRDWFPKKSESYEVASVPFATGQSIEGIVKFWLTDDNNNSISGVHDSDCAQLRADIRDIIGNRGFVCNIEPVDVGRNYYNVRDAVKEAARTALQLEGKGDLTNKSESLFNKQELEAPVKSYISNVLSDLVVSFHWGEDGAERLVDKYNDVIMTNYMDGDLSTYETAKYINDKENNNPVESKKKQESKKNEGHLELVDTIVVPKWLWDAFYFADEYGETLNEEEEEILADFKAKYADAKYHLETPEEEADFRSRNDFDEYGGPCYEIKVYEWN